MARQIWRYFSPALALVVIGCTDTVLPRAELAAPRTTTAPPGAPPEYHGESVIFNTWLDVGFDQDAKKAYVMSRMEFYARAGESMLRCRCAEAPPPLHNGLSPQRTGAGISGGVSWQTTRTG